MNHQEFVEALAYAFLAQLGEIEDPHASSGGEMVFDNHSSASPQRARPSNDALANAPQADE